MAVSAVQRTPLEVWVAILDWALYDRDTLEFDIEQRRVAADLYRRDRVMRLQDQLGIFRMVCKSWNQYLSASYDVNPISNPRMNSVRFVSRTHLIDYCEGRSNLHPILDSRQLVYIEMDYRPLYSEPAMINMLLEALTKQSRLQYLTMMFINNRFTISKPPSSVICYPNLQGLSLIFTRPGIPIPDAIFLQLRLPALAQLGIQVWHDDTRGINFVLRFVAQCGGNLEVLMLQVHNVDPEDDVPIYIPSTLWTHVPKLQMLRIPGNLRIQFSHSTLFPHVPSISLPNTLSTVSVMNPDIWTLGGWAKFAEWFSDLEVQRGDGPKALTLRLEETWEAFGSVGMLQYSRFASVLRWYGSLSKKGAIRLSDLNKVVMEDMETYLSGLVG